MTVSENAMAHQTVLGPDTQGELAPLGELFGVLDAVLLVRAPAAG